MRASTFQDTGGYDDDFFYCFESMDLALRILRAGYDILYAPTIGTVELQVGRGQHKTRSERNYYFLRNKIWVAWKNYPAVRAIRYIGPRIIRYGMRYKWVDLWFRAVIQGIVAPGSIRGKRNPLSSSNWERIREARKCHILTMSETAAAAEKS